MTTRAERRRPPSRELSETELLARLREGDESAFATLVRRHHSSLVRLALNYVSSQAVAEEVVQETWIAVLAGLDRFEGRSSLRTWLFRILMNKARTRGARDHRQVPFAALASLRLDDDGLVDPDLDRLFGPGGHWSSAPEHWSRVPDQRALDGETRQLLAEALDELPPGQREVLVLRDVEGLTSSEVCETLGLSEVNQRVLLHRARTKMRMAMEAYLSAT